MSDTTWLLAGLARVDRIVMGSILVWAALSKTLDMLTFFETIRSYKLVPENVTFTLGLSIVLAESTLGLLLLVGFASFSSAVVAVILISLFALAQVAVMLRGGRISCGCFGYRDDEEVSRYTLVRTLILGAFGILVAWQSFEPRGSFSSRDPVLSAVVFAFVDLCAGLFGVCLFLVSKNEFLNSRYPVPTRAP